MLFYCFRSGLVLDISAPYQAVVVIEAGVWGKFGRFKQIKHNNEVINILALSLQNDTTFRKPKTQNATQQSEHKQQTFTAFAQTK